MDNKKSVRTKQELEVIADEILELMITKELPIWQVKEVLKFAAERSERAVFK